MQKSTAQSLQRLKPDSMSMDTFLKQLMERWYTWPFYLQPFWITVSVGDCKYCGAINIVILANVGNDDNSVSLLG